MQEGLCLVALVHFVNRPRTDGAGVGVGVKRDLIMIVFIITFYC